MNVFLAVLVLLLAPLSLWSASDLARYRGFELGSELAVAARHAGLEVRDAKVVHQRPSLIQEIEWQVRPTSSTIPEHQDPVTGGTLSFFQGKLFRIVIVYDQYRIEGMTADDLIEGISRTYGSPTLPSTEIAFRSNYSEVAKVLARWQNDDYSYDLVRTGDQSSFALVLYARKADALAQTAILEALRLESQDAPRQAQLQEKQRLEEERLRLEKIRIANKPLFKP